MSASRARLGLAAMLALGALFPAPTSSWGSDASDASAPQANDSDRSRLECATLRLEAYPMSQVLALRALPLDLPIIYFPPPGEPQASGAADFYDGDPRLEAQAAAALARGLASFPPEERDILMLAAISHWLDADNGFLNFFLLSPGVHFVETMATLRRNGLDDYAALFARGRALFGRDYGTQATRYARWSDGNGEIRDKGLEASLQALSDAYSAMPALVERAVERIKADPKLTEVYDKRLAEVDDLERLAYLTAGLQNCLCPYADSARAKRLLAQLPPIYRQMLVLDLLDAESKNGSVDQFFYNSSGDFAPMARDALGELGLRDAAAALTRAMGRFPQPYPEDRSRRTDFMIAQGRTFDALMNEATGVLDEADLPKAMSAAAKAAGILPH